MNDLERLAFELRLPSGSRPTLGAREIFERVRRRLVERYNEPEVGPLEKGHIETVLRVLVRSAKSDFVDPGLRVDREEAARVCEMLAPWLPDPLASDPPKCEGVAACKPREIEQADAPVVIVSDDQQDGVDWKTSSFLWRGELYCDLSEDVLKAMELVTDNFKKGRPTPKAMITKNTGQESLRKLFRSGDAPKVLALLQGAGKSSKSVFLK
jgi:hypothetical protein